MSGILLFVENTHIELNIDATIYDLYLEVTEKIGKRILMYQGEKLSDLFLSIADSGISNEAVIHTRPYTEEEDIDLIHEFFNYIYNEEKDKAKMLVNIGMIINTIDEYGVSPLSYVANHGYKDLVNLLCEKGADVNIRDRFDRTPLHDVVKNNNIEITEILCKYSDNISVWDEDRKTPKDYAIEYGSLDMIKLLCKYTDTDYIKALYSAMWVAIQKNNSNRIELIRSTGIDLSLKQKK